MPPFTPSNEICEDLEQFKLIRGENAGRFGFLGKWCNSYKVEELLLLHNPAAPPPGTHPVEMETRPHKGPVRLKVSQLFA